MNGPKSTPKRRTQAERSETTRARIIEAAIECISSRGYQRTNMAAIAETAAISVGAIQHQFSDKAEVLFAVVEASLLARAADFSAAPVEGKTPEERIKAFIQRLWIDGYSGPHYRTAIEVLVAMRNDPEFMSRTSDYFERVFSILDRMWMGTFWDLDIGRERHISALRLTFATLNGLALQGLINPDDEVVDDIIENLITVITPLMSSSD